MLEVKINEGGVSSMHSFIILYFLAIFVLTIQVNAFDPDIIFYSDDVIPGLDSTFYDGMYEILNRDFNDILKDSKCFSKFPVDSNSDYIEFLGLMKTGDYFAAGRTYGNFLNKNCVAD